jgi:aldehyde dehydrogenase (NAD+)
MATDTMAAATISGGTGTAYKNLIDGEWVESSTGETFENRNPAALATWFGIFQKSSKADVEAAVDAAKASLQKVAAGPSSQARRDHRSLQPNS